MNNLKVVELLTDPDGIIHLGFSELLEGLFWQVYSLNPAALTVGLDLKNVFQYALYCGLQLLNLIHFRNFDFVFLVEVFDVAVVVLDVSLEYLQILQSVL